MTIEKVTVPDFGDVQEIIVIEVYVKVGDRVEAEESLIALESEKAVMDIPSPVTGIIEEIYVNENDVVQSGAPILSVKTEQGVAEPQASHETVLDDQAVMDEVEGVETPHFAAQSQDSDEPSSAGKKDQGPYHATPSLRAYAREKGVGLEDLVATGSKGRILKEDVDSYLQHNGVSPSVQILDPTSVAVQAKVPEIIGEDFSRFGPVESVALSRMKKVSGPHLQKSWQSVPHVTQFDEADLVELERFRSQLMEQSGSQKRYSPLVFIIKAAVAALKAFPLFNSSLQEGGASIVLKNYYNIGIAVDTDNGLVVPVIRNADTKGIVELAAELAELSESARQGTLTIDQLQGASFTISSLGGIGGTGFTPIVNVPQVAILGLSRNYMKAVWSTEQEQFTPRLTLPFSVSYDHRVIDGADGARFCRALAGYIEDLRMILL